MPLIQDPARQQSQLLAARLGQLAAGLPATRSRTPPAPDQAASPLAAILAHLGRHRMAAEDAEDMLKANEFMTGG
jgi:hypothetical protein